MLAALPPKISTCHRSLAIGFCLGVPIGVIMLAIIIAISLAIGRWFGAPLIRSTLLDPAQAQTGPTKNAAPRPTRLDFSRFYAR